MAEALGLASSVIAVVELSAKVASLCLQYSLAVKHAKEDIERLKLRVDSLAFTLNATHALLQRGDGARLIAAQKVWDTLGSTKYELERIAAELEKKLRRSRGSKTMSRLGLTALKWPLERKDVDKIIENLSKNQDIISSALQLDLA